MGMSPPISEIEFTPSTDPERRGGLVGYVSFLLEGRIRIAGATVRRTLDGKRRLVLPRRRDRHGRGHPYVRLLDPEARAALEEAILAALPAEVWS